MARNYANIFTAIWVEEREWRALPAEAQHVYLLLVTQPNISAAGLLPLTAGRWGAMASNTNAASIRKALARLDADGYLVVDEDTEEVLVRSFVRHDNGYANPRRQPSIREAARDIISPRLRRALSIELARLGCPADWLPVEPEEPDPTPDRHSDSQSDSHSDSHSPTTDRTEPGTDRVRVDTSAQIGQPETSSQVNSHSDSHLDIDGMANRFQPARTTTHNPLTTNHNPTTSALASLGGAEAPGDVIEAELVDPSPPSLFVVPDPPATNLPAVVDQENAGQITKAWIDYCAQHGVKLTNSHIKRYGASIKGALDQQFEPELIKRALADMLRDRVISRPALFDNYLTRAQTGPEMGPRRMTRTEESIARTAPTGASVGDLVRDALTRPA